MGANDIRREIGNRFLLALVGGVFSIVGYQCTSFVSSARDFQEATIKSISQLQTESRLLLERSEDDKRDIEALQRSILQTAERLARIEALLSNDRGR